MSGKDTVTFTDENFDAEVLKSGTPVLVDFWAEWCGPCKAMGPVIDELATEYAGKVKVGKLNVDDNSDSAARYGIQGIPTLILFSKGSPAKTIVGMKAKRDLQAALNQMVG